MELSRLYYGKGGEKKFQLFLRKNEERILSLLPEGISTELSVFFLSRGELKDRKLLEALSLVRGMSVTESGERILSAYPLFGSGKEERGNYSFYYVDEGFITLSNGDSGYILIKNEIGNRKFEEPKCYYRPIPLQQRVLNPNLEETIFW